MSHGGAAVLLLAYGGPDSTEDIPAYLLDIRHGRQTPPELLAEITRRYRLIGGSSPLLAITRRTASKLEERIGTPVHVGMRHWTPRIDAAVGDIAAGGLSHAVVICMAPHYSVMSIGAYRAALDAAVAKAGAPFTVDFVESWHLEPHYLRGLAGSIRSTLDRFPARERVLVVFTAHSLPASILDGGDPYDRQLRETAGRLASDLEIPEDRWTFCYQSAAKTGVPWLGPQIEERVAELAAGGEKSLLVAPIGFIADHLEVLYDIDIGAREIAKSHGARLERMPMLNDSEPLIEALAALAGARLAGARGERAG